MDRDSITEGERVYDKESVSYEVVEVLDEIASEVVAKPEKKDRGHVIYQEKTVADLNQSYPSDDIVVKVRRDDGGGTRLWPISRVAVEMEDAFDG